ncbi:MAG: hypothetical protein K5Q00_04070 [Gammaproteobacteria bacterium]|nr:hypothetical protein [Gammaproteobacteria bacterium]
MSTKRSRWVLGALCVIFGGPVVAAVLLYLWQPDWIDRTSNRGYLIDPPKQFESLQLRAASGQAAKQFGQGQWVMVFVTPAPCADVCKQNLYRMQQVYKSFLEKDKPRIARLLLMYQPQADKGFSQWLAATYPGTSYLIVDSTQFKQLVSDLPSEQAALAQGVLYLVDPNGNLMMSYSADAQPKNILNDLRKLLRSSNIG